MGKPERIFNISTLTGEPHQIGHINVVPQSQAWVLRGSGWGFVWNRPLAVLVEQQGQVSRIPVVDVTRWVILTLFGLVLLQGIFLWINRINYILKEKIR